MYGSLRALTLRGAGLLLVTTGLVACGDSTQPLRPARLEVAAGDAQTGVVGNVLAVEPAVRVLSEEGEPVSRVSVRFEVVTGGGTVERTRVSTNGSGVASAGEWQLGTGSGTHELRASVTGVPPLVLQATGTPAAPGAVRVVSGDGQRAAAGSAVPQSPVVRVTDAYDNPVAGVPVAFTVTSGGGLVANPTAVTQSDGTASAGSWTLGGPAGAQTLVAAAGSAGAVQFTATAEAAEAQQLTFRLPPPNNATSGAPLPVQPIVQVADRFGNAVPLAGVAVTATTNAGILANVTATTDAAGAATFSALTITGLVGNYTLTFTAGALTPVATSIITLGPGTANRLGIAVGLPPAVVSGVVFSTQPVVEVQDIVGNRVTTANHTVTAALASGMGVLNGTLTATAVLGQASFTNLAYAGTDPFVLRFSATGLQPVTSEPITVTPGVVCTGANALALDFVLGQTMRFRPDSDVTPQCLQFDLARNLNHQYLVMLENMPRTGDYASSLFPGTNTNTGYITVTVSSNAVSTATSASRPVGNSRAAVLPPGMSNAWDFGSGPIYEYAPPEPPGGAPAPLLVKGSQRISLNGSSAVAPQLGDTIVVYLVGISRLRIQDGNQRAVVRHISNELIIAEDVRLDTLRRASGGVNTKLTQADMDSIASAYSAHSRVQGDLLFQGRYNLATELEQPPRIIAVHTLMPSDNVWGYTFSSTNVFAWDFWVSTDGSTRGLAQHPLRNAHNLFMHEIAHTRHWGLLERANRQVRGNRWLVEGFARFSERLPIASYLLGSPNPSRAGNVTLGSYPEYTVRFRDDVPTYLNIGFSMFDGYQSSSYVFDYLADQVALAGGDWRTAITDFLTNAGVEQDLDATVNTLLPGLTFEQLFTRARLALYLDDIGTPGLPAWTQYHQYNLRQSREPASAASFDPRNAWQRIQPDTAFNEARAIFPGASFGYLIDGSGATSSSQITFEFGTPANGVISVTRIR